MYLAVDVGGTKTLIAVFAPNGEVVESQKFPTSQDYTQFKLDLANNVAELSTKEFLGGGIGMPGSIDREKGMNISGGFNLAWKDSPIRDDLQQIIGVPVVVENDASLAGLSEAVLVKDRYRKALYITISTGIGGGYAIDGVLDPNTLSAEVGHMVFEHENRYQLWENIASGKAIVEKYGKRASEIEDPQIWEAICKNIAPGIINVSAVLTPDVIIIGGGVGSHLPKFIEPLNQSILKIKSPLVTVPPILQAQRPEEAVIYGCYEFAKQHHEKITA